MTTSPPTRQPLRDRTQQAQNDWGTEHDDGGVGKAPWQPLLRFIAPSSMRSGSAPAKLRQVRECSCNDGRICEDHPDQPWQHDGCGGAGMLCENPDCVVGRTLRAELDARRQADTPST
jgi:hypothetical protein